jgi:sodium-dependent phosphate transporter
MALSISLGASLLVAILVQLFVVPMQRKKILGQTTDGQPVKFTFGDSDGESFSSCYQWTL